MNKETKQSVDENLHAEREIMIKEMWELIDRIKNVAYNHTHDQLKDASRIGKLADAALAIDCARSNFREAVSE